MRKGVAPVQPSVWAASLHARLCAITSGERSVGEQPGDRERALRKDAAVLDRDDAAADLGQPLDRERHVGVGHPDDDDVVRVVRHGRGERSTPETGARDEAAPDAAGRQMTLDDGDLREVAVDRGDDESVRDRGLA